MFYVYLLQNRYKDQIYIGSTKDLRKRLSEHNRGQEKSTKRYLPWELIYYEAFEIEKYLISMKCKLIHAFKKSAGLHTGAGFTLVELLIIIAVIGVLASGLIILINPASQMQKARDSKVKSNLSQVQTALELYRADCGSYPASITSGGSLSSACTGPTITYLQILPPFTNYTPGSGNQTYTLRGCLEWNDPQITTTFASCTTSHDKAYVVTSP